MLLRKCLAFGVCFFFTASLSFGQVETARITGTVRDNTGAVLPNTEIMITHLTTNRQFVIHTDGTGNYLSVALPLGGYRVEAERPGFKHAARTGLTLQVQQTAVVDFNLEVGDVTERLVVTAEAPLLSTTEATQGQVIENKRIVDMPLNGRDYIQLALLSSGTAQPLGGRFGGFTAGGQRTTQNNYLLDGIDNNNYQNASQSGQAEAMKPSVDAVQEFKILTNSFSAEYGRAAGAVVNVVLKSGTNEFHGAAFGFLRNQALDARNFFDRPGQPKPPFKRSQFGGALGGPIIRNRTFFFGDYEGTRIRESRTVTNTIPTPAMRAGDFSALSTTIYDPLTFDPGTRNRTAFPNNRIPDQRIDPVAKAAAAWYPDPQNTSFTQNFLYNPPRRANIDKYDARVDHSVGSSDNVYYRLSHQKEVTPPSPNLPEPAFGGGASETTNDGTNMALVWNHIVSPALVTSTRLGWNRALTSILPPVSRNLNAQIGLNGVEQSEPGGAAFNISGYSTLGLGGFLPLYADSQVRQLINDSTWTKGRHSIKFGTNLMWLQVYLNNLRQAQGIFSFNGSFARNPSNLQGGNPFADFLLGFPSQTNFSNSIYMNARTNWVSLYLNDEWRATSRLTLNVGLRYELRRPWVETRNFNSIFDIDTDLANPHWVVAKDGSRFDRALVEAAGNNFAPRFGFAYQVGPETVVRGGYGIYLGMTENSIGLGPFNPPFMIGIAQIEDGVTPGISLRQGIPAGILTPQKAGTIGANSALEIRPSLPYSQQWNFNIQRQIGQSWLAEVGYSANVAHHLEKEWNYNYALPGPGSLQSRRRFQSAIWPGTNIVVPVSTVQRVQWDGNSGFHSLQTKLQRSFVRGLSVLGSYVWSKTTGDSCGKSASGNSPGCGYQDPLNHRLERALDNQHVAHRFVLSPIWELPFGKDRSVGSGWSAVPNALFGDWSLASIVTLASGTPMSVTVQGDPANTGNVNRPDVIGNPFLDREDRTPERWFNTNAFARNQQFAYGNAGRNILLQPGVANVDFAAYKRFVVTEGTSVQLRFEAFNLFNTPSFNSPNATLGNPEFGRITAAGRQRNLQFGLKVVF